MTLDISSRCSVLPSSLWAGVTAFALVAAAALVAAGAERWLDPQSLALFFVVPVVVAAIRYGVWASLGASVFSALALNYLFVEPRYTFVVARPQDVAALMLFSIVAVLASAIAARARAAALSADARAREASLMQVLATKLAGIGAEADIAAAAVEAISALSERRGLLITADERHWGEGFDEVANDVARWSMSTKQSFAPGPEAPVAAPWSFWPIIFAGRCEMAIGVNAPEALTPQIGRAAGQIAAQVGLAMDRARVAGLAEAARLDAERERLKADLLAGVSHDLRTPLATILFTLQSLQRFASEHSREAHAELLALAEAEARRLADMVDMLLDASRIGAAGVPVRLAPVEPAILVEQARAALGAEANGREIIVQVADDLPPIAADAPLAARALANVLSNALRHGGGAAVYVAARCQEGEVVIEISDRGPGLGADPERLFAPFVRGALGDGRAPGLGLGLSLARKFLESQGAAISAESRIGGGAQFNVRFACVGADYAG
jgi:two-component system sensor histidine kinase KdpD